MRARIAVVAALLLVGVAVVTLVLKSRAAHGLWVKAYFEDAQGMQPGAPVQLAGIKVGSVASIRFEPSKPDHPAEVVMLLQARDDLSIPNDSVALIETAGVLGPPMVVIDTLNAKGPAIRDGGTLQTVVIKHITDRQLLDCLSRISNHQPCSSPESNANDQKTH